MVLARALIIAIVSLAMVLAPQFGRWPGIADDAGVATAQGLGASAGSPGLRVVAQDDDDEDDDDEDNDDEDDDDEDNDDEDDDDKDNDDEDDDDEDDDDDDDDGEDENIYSEEPVRTGGGIDPEDLGTSDGVVNPGAEDLGIKDEDDDD